MRISLLLSAFATGSLFAARSTRHVGKKEFVKPAAKLESRQSKESANPQSSEHGYHKRQYGYRNPYSESNATHPITKQTRPADPRD